MQRYYSIPLTDLFTGRLSWRRLRVLVTHLPREAATVRAQHGEKMLWGDLEHLAAATVDLLAQANWQRAQAGSKCRIPRPKLLPRPGEQHDTGKRYGRTELSPQDVKRLLASFDPVTVEGDSADG